MASQGPLSPGTLASNSAVGTVAWVNPANAAASDNSYATAEVTGVLATTHYLFATGLGFSIPAGATVNGVVVEVELKANSAGFDFDNASDSDIRLVVGGAAAGTNKARSAFFTWATTDTYITYGGAADLWGLTPTADQVNAADFGVGVSAKLNGTVVGGLIRASIDHVRVTVYYTAAAPPADATGTAPLTFAASAAAAPLATATGTAALTFTTSSAGGSLAAGAGSSAVAFAAAGVGSPLADAAGTAPLSLAAAAVGGSLFDGSGAAGLTFAAAGGGSALVAAAGTAGLTFTVAGAGAAGAPAAGLLTLFVLAGGTLTLTSLSAATLTLTAHPAGSLAPVAHATGTLTLAPLAGATLTLE